MDQIIRRGAESLGLGGEREGGLMSGEHEGLGEGLLGGERERLMGGEGEGFGEGMSEEGFGEGGEGFGREEGE